MREATDWYETEVEQITARQLREEKVRRWSDENASLVITTEEEALVAQTSAEMRVDTEKK